MVCIGTVRAMPRDAFEREARYLSGGGGLHVTAGDYARFAQALLDGGGPILSRTSVHAMTTNQIGELTAFGARIRRLADPSPSRDRCLRTMRRQSDRPHRPSEWPRLHRGQHGRKRSSVN